MDSMGTTLVVGCVGAAALLFVVGMVADWLLSERHPHNQRHQEPPQTPQEERDTEPRQKAG